MIATSSEWLARQQQDDGSWPRFEGYTGRHYDTAWAGLALMATGDAKYDDAIRRGAEYVAFRAASDEWSIPSACALLFLSEYWLRYHDDRVVPAIRVWADRIVREYVQGDYTAGHGFNPGYRGTGISIGASHVALALAVANRTPVHIDGDLIDAMLEQVQMIAPGGFVSLRPGCRGMSTNARRGACRGCHLRWASRSVPARLVDSRWAEAVHGIVLGNLP